MADVIKSFIVEYAPHSATAPASWTKIEHSVRSIPNLFPIPDAVDCSVVTDDRASTVAGVEKAEALTFKIAPDLAFLAAHTAMVTEQNNPEKGYFWMRITYPKRGYSVTFKATTVDELATPSGELGALDEIDWPVYSQGDKAKAAITDENSGS